MKLAIAIRDLRYSMGMTRPVFAKVCGVSMYTVRSWEEGETMPRTKNRKRLIKIARQLKE